FDFPGSDPSDLRGVAAAGCLWSHLGAHPGAAGARARGRRMPPAAARPGERGPATSADSAGRSSARRFRTLPALECDRTGADRIVALLLSRRVPLDRRRESTPDRAHRRGAMKSLVTGGAGYVGSVLVKRLVQNSIEPNEVRVLDTFWFRSDPRVYRWCISEIEGDIRDLDVVRAACDGVEAVFHLACLSNDPASDLDPKLTRAINYDGSLNVIHAAKAAGVKRFIYASSASVYGVRSEPEITEDLTLAPITLYSHYKAEVEQALFAEASDDFIVTAIRPSTVYGYAEQMRFDLLVHMLVRDAYRGGQIVLYDGGHRLRPLIHIEDIVECYRRVLAAEPVSVQAQAFNAS